jgi:hypothetical protein
MALAAILEDYPHAKIAGLVGISKLSQGTGDE